MAEAQSTLDAASERIRETAKWLTISLAALGGVLVAGSQLSDIGALQLWSDRFWTALIGAAIAATGSGIILIATITTSASRAVSLKELAGTKPPKGAKEAITDETLLDGREKVADLKDDYIAALGERDQTYSAHLDNLSDETKRTRFVTANARVVALNGVAKNLVDVAAYRELARLWRLARIAIVAGGAVAAFGVGVFAWAANPPEKVVASTAEPAVLDAPEKATITLTETGREALGSTLGKTCPLTAPISVLKLGTTAAGPDALVQQAGCEAVRFVLAPTWGSAG